MIKQIVILESKNKEGKIKDISIFLQTHYEEEFGNNESFFKYLEEGVGSFVLAYKDVPHIMSSDYAKDNYGCDYGLALCGDLKDHDNDVISIPSNLPEKWFYLMHKAIERYNKENNACTECSSRHCNMCGIIQQDLPTIKSSEDGMTEEEFWDNYDEE